MAENKKSVFNKLNDLLLFKGGFEGSFENKEEKVIIKGDSYEDVLKKQIELQQQEQLYSQFYKVEKNQLQKTMQYEAQRLPAFMDYEGMEYYPMIAAALDLYAEEATTIGENGKMLNIYSKSDRIKKILEDLFYDVININTNLISWTRTMPVKHDSIIPLLDGTEVTIKELSERLEKNPDQKIWTYSVQDQTNKILPGKIVWCGLTRKDSEIVRVTFDDGTYTETTPDHEYILRNGQKAQAKDLKVNQSVMPFYTKKSDKKKDCIDGYEKVYNPSTNYHLFTHRLVAHELVRDIEYENTINENIDTHHENFNKLDNSPSNLIRMKHSEHFKLHSDLAIKNLHTPEVTKKRLAGIDKYLRSEKRRKRMSEEMMGIYPEYFNEYNNSKLHKEHNNIRKEAMLSHWSDEKYRESTSKKMKLVFSEKSINILKNILLENNKFLSKTDICKILLNNEEFLNDFIKINTHNKRDVIKSLNPNTLEILIKRKINLGFHDLYVDVNKNITDDKNFKKALNISKAKKNKLKNHKVVSVEWIEEKSDVYCMEVVGPNGEHDRHNFPICSKDNDGNYTRNGVFVSNCKYGDNMIYLLPEKGKGITMVKQLPVFEIERKEDVINNKLKIWFKRRDNAQEFTPMEIAHFRLAGDDKYYPYGTSVLNKGRRIWRQCIMAEDAMLSYRILRAGEKRVFKIDVGNLDVNDIEPYIQKVATKFKRSPQVNRENGNIDHRFNILGNDEDYFIPVRNSNAGTVIDTLPGGESLDKIADIEYLRDNLFTSLGVPKPFLGYQNTAGEGKNLAQQDMRFSKKVNRIQQSIVQELNKIAIIHLYLLGFEDELDNFSLSLSSPSNQAEILKTELLTLKMQLYNDITTSQDNGIAATSHTWAKKHILNWSEDEIIKDYENQMMERVVVQELQNATNLFAKTGIFDNIITKYGAKAGEKPISQPSEGDEMDDSESDFSSLGSPSEPPSTEEPAGMPEMGETVRFKNNKLIMELLSSNVRDEDKNLIQEYKLSQDKSNDLINKTMDSIKEIDKNLKK